MKESERIFKKLQKSRLVALLSPKNVLECVTAYEICQEQGIILEIALRSEYALEGIDTVKIKYPDALLLAGTVMTGGQAEKGIKAGAAGIVSADYIPEVVDVCVKNDVLCIPGGLSDVGKQLARKAQRYGVSLEELHQNFPYQWIYKLFPAFAGHISNIDLALSWKGPYKKLTVVYTGGITRETLRQAVRKDPRGIFCASALTKNIDEPERMREEIKQWKSLLGPASPPKVSPPAEAATLEIQKPKAVSFGELMMRLSPPSGIRLQKARGFAVHFGGAEANVAVSLASFGCQASFVSALPDNPLGDNAVDVLKQYGVDTRFIVRKGERIGIYYLEHGSGPRPSRVFYDRSHSAVSKIDPEDLNWEEVFQDARWFHWSGITPALSDSVEAVLREGLDLAKEKGLTVSADLNYRKKLWSEEKAQEVMTGLMSYVDILIGNEEDPIKVFGINPEGTDVNSGKLSAAGYKALTKKLVKRFGFQKVAITLRKSLSASENYWSACLYNGKDFLQSPRYHISILDRVGTGDAFAAGLIFKLLQGKSDAEALDFGVAAACLKHTIWGDFNAVSIEEVERLAGGETTGRVRR